MHCCLVLYKCDRCTIRVQRVDLLTATKNWVTWKLRMKHHFSFADLDGLTLITNILTFISKQYRFINWAVWDRINDAAYVQKIWNPYADITFLWHIGANNWCWYEEGSFFSTMFRPFMESLRNTHIAAQYESSTWYHYYQGPLLLTRFNFNLSMDK